MSDGIGDGIDGMADGRVDGMTEDIASLRAAIDAVDDRLLALLAERLDLVRTIGRVKAAAGPIGPDPQREAAIIDRLAANGALPAAIVAAVWQAVFAASHAVQREAIAMPSPR
jgi:chorismate mutase/prephenate dehydratase